MKFEQYDYSIAEHWLSPLINGDYKGLEDDEEKQLDAFLESLPSNNGHWSIPDEQPDFRMDDVSGLYAMCVTASYMVPK